MRRSYQSADFSQDVSRGFFWEGGRCEGGSGCFLEGRRQEGEGIRVGLTKEWRG